MAYPCPRIPMDEPTLTYHPGVFMVEDDYEIIFICRRPALASVVVDGMTFTDNMNGVMCTDTEVHKIKVPMILLDQAKKYRVHLAPLADHCNYYPKPEPTEVYEYCFTPVPAEGKIEVFVLADTHGDAVTPAQAALSRSRIDMLMLVGDIGDSAATRDQVVTLHRLAAEITKGEIPALYVRGNHDTRGYMAENLGDYIPLRDGKTYYTFRAGSVWGVVLDCGEDKPDTSIEYGSPEYGGVADFLPFRHAQTAYLKSLVAKGDFKDQSIRHRIAVCHINFTDSGRAYQDKNPEIYEEWIACLNQMEIDLLICGHHHAVGEQTPNFFTGNPKPTFNTLLTAARLDHPIPLKGGHKAGEYTGTAITFEENGIKRVFVNHLGESFNF
ncbi:MAG: metallophosphoesterase [Ruminococcaceae bacterium]|nr:metallophosphoesterase [Oscillospiraceae bacterium]